MNLTHQQHIDAIYNEVVATTARIWGIDKHLILSKSRLREVAEARQAAIARTADITRASRAAVARACDKEQSTIGHCRRKAAALTKTDRIYRDLYNRLLTETTHLE